MGLEGGGRLPRPPVTSPPTPLSSLSGHAVTADRLPGRDLPVPGGPRGCRRGLLTKQHSLGSCFPFTSVPAEEEPFKAAVSCPFLFLTVDHLASGSLFLCAGWEDCGLGGLWGEKRGDFA